MDKIKQDMTEKKNIKKGTQFLAQLFHFPVRWLPKKYSNLHFYGVGIVEKMEKSMFMMMIFQKLV
jgi:hypothetical protein